MLSEFVSFLKKVAKKLKSSFFLNFQVWGSVSDRTAVRQKLSFRAICFHLAVPVNFSKTGTPEAQRGTVKFRSRETMYQAILSFLLMEILF
jgi:hypothetical protein